MNKNDIQILKSLDECNIVYYIDIPDDNLNQAYSCYKITFDDNQLYTIEKIDNIMALLEKREVSFMQLESTATEYGYVYKILKDSLEHQKDNQFTYKKN